IDIPDGMLMPDAIERLEQRELEVRSLIAGGERSSLLEQVASLERSNTKLQGTMMMERARSDRFQRRVRFMKSELRQIRRFRYYNRMRFRRLETFAARCLGILKLYKLTHIRREERKGLPIKVATPQVFAIQGGRNQKPNKKPQAAKGNGKGKGNGKFKLAYSPKPKNPSPAKKEHPKKDVTCHHYKEGLRGERKLKHEAIYMYVEFFEKNLIPQKASEKVVELEEIQDGDTSPSKNTSEHLVEAESLTPQEDVAPICRSVRIYRSPERLCLNVKVNEHSLGDLNELTNYKAALSYPNFGKWFDAMNVEMQSIKDNQVWNLVDLPPNAKTFGSK
nr:hypothetical protein [Tanacetum cinerariifolium]